MKKIPIIGALLLAWLASGCSRKQAQVAPPPPEVVVATVTQRDIPVVQEAVATLDGFSNANINAQVQGYLIASSDSAAVLFGRT
jgi:multidrug efflux pump subunit AcrA (membrane-fusion protein)